MILGLFISMHSEYSPEDFIAIARLHAAGIKQGFLPTLGERFLGLLYDSMDADSSSVLLVERSNTGEILGFVGGGRGMRSIYLQMLRRWPRLFSALFPAISNPIKIRRIFEVLFLSFRLKPCPACPRAELFSISVADFARGNGVAKKLYSDLAVHFAKDGETEFCIVVGEDLAPAHRFYRKMGAEPIARIRVHKGETSIVYRQALPVVADGSLTQIFKF